MSHKFIIKSRDCASMEVAYLNLGQDADCRKRKHFSYSNFSVSHHFNVNCEEQKNRIIATYNSKIRPSMGIEVLDGLPMA